jgi:uncharacterized protein YaaW (UPF0174 family)
MYELEALLNRVSYEKRLGLGKILGIESASSQKLIDQLRWNYQPWWNSVLKLEPSYREIVEHVAQHLKVSYPNYYETREIEIKIAQKVFEVVWERMTPQQRRDMEEELRRAAQKFGSFAASGSMFAVLTAARLSGFGVYLLASTSLGALTSALGITLPFAVYTGMSSAIAFIIGPAGWISAALFAIWKSGESNKEKLITAIVYICMLRCEVQSGNGSSPSSIIASNTRSPLEPPKAGSASKIRPPLEPPKVDPKYRRS